MSIIVIKMSDKCTKSTTLVVSGVAITRFYGLWVFMLKSYGLWVFGLKSYGLWVARPPQNPPLYSINLFVCIWQCDA